MPTIKKPKSKKKSKRKKLRHKKQATFRRLKCAPRQEKRVDPALRDLTCYSNEDLFKFKEAWNASNAATNPINTNDPRAIWLFFRRNLTKHCYDELCWLNDATFHVKIDKEKMAQNIFRPFSPREWKKKPFEWLSSVDINKVMRQYEENYPNFKFIGPSPIDYDHKELYGSCVWEQLCKFNLKEYKTQEVTKIGIVFNLDKHDQPGSHWVALFVDLDKGFIFYFDSNGVRAPTQIIKLKDEIRSQANEMGISLKYHTNNGMEHQKLDGQCGMYVLYFIVQLLKEDRTYDFFKTTRITDEMMCDYRERYYNEKRMK